MSSLAFGTQKDILINRLWPEAHVHRVLRHAALIAVGSLLLALSSQLSIPLWPVPMTGQTFAVLLIGMAYGARLGMLTVLAYLVEGAVGFPFFAGGAAGMAVLMGPLSGYLLGFVLAAGVTGWLAQRGWDRSPTRTALAMLLGNAVIYVPGLLVLGSTLHLSLSTALAEGMYPFLIGDLTKLLLAMVTMPAVWNLLRRWER